MRGGRETAAVLRGRDITLRLIAPEDAEAYFHAGFDPMDPEVRRLTGTWTEADLEAIRDYVKRVSRDPDRRDFLILDPSGAILGESVLNELDRENASVNFRICLFQSGMCGQGIGREAICLTLEYAFRSWGIHRVELDVYDFNPRAYAVYRQVGFREEGRRREALWAEGTYHDDILMAILAWEFERGRPMELKESERSEDLNS